MNWLPRTGLLVGMVLIGTAFRRFLDLGDVVGSGLFWSLLAIGAVLLALGVPSHLATSEGEGGTKGSRWQPWLLVIGLLWMLTVPTEAAIAVVVGTGAMLGLEMLGRKRLAGALQFVMLALVVTTLVHLLVDRLALMRYVATYVTDLVASGLQLLGVTAGSGGDVVVLKGPESDPGFRATALNLGLGLHLSLAALLLLVRLLPGSTRPAAGGWLAPLGYLLIAAPLRFVAMIGLAIALQHGVGHKDLNFDMAVFLDWRFGLAIDLFSAMVAGFLVLRRTRREATPGDAPSEQGEAAQQAPQQASQQAPLPASWRPRLAGAAVLVGLLGSSDRILDCFGAEKAGRIAIDESHSRWESSDVPLTRDHYGQESGYNFRGIADWLETGYGPIRRLYDPINKEALDNVDVLIVKTPTTAFEPSELERIHAYVENGGGLILIGDHTNVYGTSEVLNQIAQPYGFRFVYDCCFDHRNRYEFCYRTETPVRNHPITRDVDTMLFQVGCTIDIDSPQVRPILVGRSLKSQMIDYSAQNFYGAPKDTSEQHKGQFAELVTCASGNGRVVAIADSTLFSTFSVFMPGRREIVEGMVAYANHTDVGATLRELLQRLAIGLGLCLLVLVVPRMGPSFLLSCAVLAWGSGNVGVVIAESWIYPGNPALASPDEVKFLWEDDSVDWGVHAFVSDHASNFDLFFQFATRSNRFPRLVRSLEAATSTSGPIVWIDPDPEDLERSAQLLTDFVASGGDLMLLERTPNPLLTAVAERVGLAMQPAPAELPAGGFVASKFGEIRLPFGTRPFRSIVGGDPILTLRGGPDDHQVAVVHAHGEGRVAILSCGALFANNVYGGRYGSIPNESLRRLYEVQYTMFAAMSDRSGWVEK